MRGENNKKKRSEEDKYKISNNTNKKEKIKRFQHRGGFIDFYGPGKVLRMNFGTEFLPKLGTVAATNIY